MSIGHDSYDDDGVLTQLIDFSPTNIRIESGAKF